MFKDIDSPEDGLNLSRDNSIDSPHNTKVPYKQKSKNNFKPKLILYHNFNRAALGQQKGRKKMSSEDSFTTIHSFNEHLESISKESIPL